MAVLAASCAVLILVLAATVFSSGGRLFTSAYDDHLLTPYSRNLPEDGDALYQAYCELRLAQALKAAADGVQADAPGRLVLFSPSPEEVELEDERWPSVISHGLSVILDMVPL